MGGVEGGEDEPATMASDEFRISMPGERTEAGEEDADDGSEMTVMVRTLFAGATRASGVEPPA